jgi:hypothetical protein
MYDNTYHKAGRGPATPDGGDRPGDCREMPQGKNHEPHEEGKANHQQGNTK